jgi:hypothetical protein
LSPELYSKLNRLFPSTVLNPEFLSCMSDTFFGFYIEDLKDQGGKEYLLAAQKRNKK